MKKSCLLAIICIVGLSGAGQALAEPAPGPAVMPTNVNTPVNTIDVAKLKSGQVTLNVGHYNHLPPFYFAGSNLQPGFGHEILDAVANQAGIHLNYIGFDNLTDLNTQLEQGKIDLIANAWDLPGMRKRFLLTAPYFTKGGLSFLYFKQKGPFKTSEDLKNHRVGVFKRGYADHYWLPTHNVSRETIKEYDTLKELLFALKEDRVDVAVVYYPLARLAQQQLTDQLTAVLVQPINDVYAVRKQDTPLQALLDQALQELTTNGTLDKIPTQYFDPSTIAPTNSENT